MKFALKKYVLQGLLEKAAMVLGSKDITPILKNFDCRLTPPNRLEVIATDLALSVVAETTQAKVEAKGRAVFPGIKLLELVRVAEEALVEFDVSKVEAEITCARAKWTLKLMNAVDFPEIPRVEEIAFDAVMRADFLAALQRTYAAVPMSAHRPELSIVNIANGKVQATDGVRFHQSLLGYKGDVQIPVQAVDDLIRFLRLMEDEKIRIAQTDNHVVFKFGVDTFIATKATASFPDVERLLLKPTVTANKEKLLVDRQQFIDGIKRVRLTADMDTNLMVLDLTKDLLVLSSKDRYGNRATQELDVSWKGDERKLGFNWIYLLDSLQALEGKAATVKLGPDTKQKRSPMLLEDKNFVAILNQLRMPV